MSFSYKPLPAGHIRLLRPAGYRELTVNTSLAFTLETFQIADAPPYTAVSYVWGLGAASQTIFLNGASFAVRQNLWSCLHYLILPTINPYQSRLWNHVWVDAVCINQGDEREKSSQVRAMDRIFSNAVEVTAWLGLHRLPNWIQWREAATKTVDHGDWDFIDNVFDIAERPYWSRMWIVQELLLAKRVRLQVSGSSFDFHDLADHVQDVHAHTSATEDLRRLLAYVKGRDLDNLQMGRPLRDLLLEFADCQCQDPRDNVFAIMSLLGYEDKLNLGNYFPDYSLTHDAVVIITISYLKNRYGEEITHGLDLIFDSLGVSKSRLMRRRLLAVAETFDVYSDRDLSSKADFLPITYFGGENDLYPQETPTKPTKILISGVAANLGWIFSCFGLFRSRRDPHQHAFLDFREQFQR